MANNRKSEYYASDKIDDDPFAWHGAFNEPEKKDEYTLKEARDRDQNIVPCVVCEHSSLNNRGVLCGKGQCNEENNNKWFKSILKTQKICGNCKQAVDCYTLRDPSCNNHEKFEYRFSEDKEEVVEPEKLEKVDALQQKIDAVFENRKKTIEKFMVLKDYPLWKNKYGYVNNDGSLIFSNEFVTYLQKQEKELQYQVIITKKRRKTIETRKGAELYNALCSLNIYRYKDTTFENSYKVDLDEWKLLEKAMSLCLKHAEAYLISIKKAELYKLTQCEKLGDCDKVCTKCGSIVKIEAKYCSECGGILQ